MKTSDAQFKRDLDSITFEDIQKAQALREAHPIKLDTNVTPGLKMPLKLADQYVEVIKDFLSDLNFSSDRIEAVESRRRDGFIPHSWNKGGLQAYCYLSQTCLPNGNTGFENTDNLLEKYHAQTLKDWMEENKHPSTDSMNEFDWENFYEYESSSEDTIQFQARVVMTSETTANVDFYVSCSDSPYHRSSDDKLEIEIEFKSPAGMKRKLKQILKRDFVTCLKNNVREGF